MTLSVVIFDLDGTLRHDRPSGGDLWAQALAAHGYPLTPEAARDLARWSHYFWASSPELRALLEAHGDDTEGFWVAYTQRKLERAGVPPEEAAALAPQVHAMVSAAYQEAEDWVPPDVPRALARLKALGYRLAVLTNRSQPLNGYLDELGLGEYFEVALTAGELGAWKPDPEVFRRFLKHLDIPPEAAAYVGDNYYADVLGARRAGLWPVLLDPKGLFPEAECPTITRLDELPPLLEALHREGHRVAPAA